jgi:hypothetical protein
MRPKSPCPGSWDFSQHRSTDTEPPALDRPAAFLSFRGPFRWKCDPRQRIPCYNVAYGNPARDARFLKVQEGESEPRYPFSCSFDGRLKTHDAEVLCAKRR